MKALMKAAEVEIRKLKKDNDLIQKEKQTEFVANQEKVSRMQAHIISGLANLIESRDLETGEHVTRTRSYAKALSEFARSDLGFVSAARSVCFLNVLLEGVRC